MVPSPPFLSCASRIFCSMVPSVCVVDLSVPSHRFLFPHFLVSFPPSLKTAQPSQSVDIAARAGGEAEKMLVTASPEAEKKEFTCPCHVFTHSLLHFMSVAGVGVVVRSVLTQKGLRRVCCHFISAREPRPEPDQTRPRPGPEPDSDQTRPGPRPDPPSLLPRPVRPARPLQHRTAPRTQTHHHRARLTPRAHFHSTLCLFVCLFASQDPPNSGGHLPDSNRGDSRGDRL